jgi:DNA-binding winged helix-turn-helix (wHTH) protein
MNEHIEKSLLIGEWRADPTVDRLSRNSEVVKLEPRTMRLLMYMAARPGAVISVQEILQYLWTDVIVSPESVYQAVATLRRALGDKRGDPSYIVTVPRRGYRLVADVSLWAEPKPIETIAPIAPPEREVSSEPTRDTLAVSRPRFLSRPILIACVAGLALSSLMAVRYMRSHSNSHLTTTIVNFDDLPTPGQQGTAGIGLIPLSYAGLDWSCTGNPRCTVVNGSTYGSNPSGYQGAVVSRSNVLSTGYGAGFVASYLKITRTGGGVFSLNGAYFTSPWFDGLRVAVVGENGKANFNNVSFGLDEAGKPRFHSFNWNNLTSVFITASGGHPNQAYKSIAIPLLAIDDLTYTAEESGTSSSKR